MAIKISDPSIKLADNGFIVCYREQEEKPKSGNTYDYCSSSYKELVFTEDQTDEAMAKFIELGKATGKLKGTTKEKEEY